MRYKPPFTLPEPLFLQKTQHYQRQKPPCVFFNACRACVCMLLSPYIRYMWRGKRGQLEKNILQWPGAFEYPRMASEIGSPMQSICTANPIRTAIGACESLKGTADNGTTTAFINK